MKGSTQIMVTFNCLANEALEALLDDYVNHVHSWMNVVFVDSVIRSKRT